MRASNATQQPRTGRPPARNLHRDGYETVANWIKLRLLSVKGPHLVEVQDDSGVRLIERNKLSADDFAARTARPSYLGTYNRSVLTEHLEDDLLDWLRQSRQETQP